MLREQSAASPPLSRVEKISSGNTTRISLVDPATIVESVNSDGDTVYEYDYYVITRQWYADLPDAVAGDFTAWLDMAREDDQMRMADSMRSVRDLLLSDTDYLVALDYPIPDAVRAAVIAYRQALRDITEQEGFPNNVAWPVKPLVTTGAHSVEQIIEQIVGEGQP